VIGLLSAAGVVALVIGWAEVVHWRASHRLTNPDHGGTEAVVVLGYRNRGRDHANALNRWRVRAGLRSIDHTAPLSRLVFSGGSDDGEGVSEAAPMARYAVEHCGFTGEVVVEEESRTTWENVEKIIPLVEDAERIKFVSNPLHAEKARLYLRFQRPDLAPRMVRSADYRIGEWAPLKPLFAVYGLVAVARARKNLSSAA
jgi:uncharacterized SAM-binding protein YcdF (DUF218 family)